MTQLTRQSLKAIAIKKWERGEITMDQLVIALDQIGIRGAIEPAPTPTMDDGFIGYDYVDQKWMSL